MRVIVEGFDYYGIVGCVSAAFCVFGGEGNEKACLLCGTRVRGSAWILVYLEGES